MTKRAVLYIRLSNASEASTSLGRQESDLRDLAAREAWDVVGVLADDGISGRKVRANANEALRMLADGEADVLAVWKFDRWSRQGLPAVGRLIDFLDSHPAATFVALSDNLRSDQKTWRMMAGILSEMARDEAENTSLRVRSSMRELKHSGRFSGGVVPYGYRPVPNPHGEGRILTIVPHEAETIRDLVSRVLNDDAPITRLVFDLNERNIPTPRSPYRVAELAGRDPEGLDRARWQITSLQIMLTGDALLGRVKHQGALVVGPDGLPAQVWEPVLELSTLQRLRSRIGNPRQKSDRPRRVRATRLLSGLVSCALCGSNMHLNAQPNGGSGYRCSGPVNGKECRGPAISAESFERHVEERFLGIFGKLSEFVEDVDTVDPEVAAELAEIEASLAEITSRMMDDDSDVASLAIQLGALKNRRSELRALPATAKTTRMIPTGRSLSEAWAADAENTHSRREILSRYVETITIGARVRRGPKFDESRVTIHWSDWADADDAGGDSLGVPAHVINTSAQLGHI